ncbi:hypothetical protein GCM10010151_45430 [Actinoallomurus spadix]|uniref:Uncharacterized protein n=1 Tax=Actinoallomurus spadix TaxID=79912 RepID=A0ABN0WYT6_9ACTN
MSSPLVRPLLWEPESEWPLGAGLELVKGGGSFTRAPGPDDVGVTTSSPARPVTPFVPDAWSPPAPGPLNDTSPGLTSGGT